MSAQIISLFSTVESQWNPEEHIEMLQRLQSDFHKLSVIQKQQVFDNVSNSLIQIFSKVKLTKES
jgi:hypothetical protein